MFEDLIEQAYGLAKVDKLRPKQANLRRAISSAYYAMFHLLVNEACVAQLGTQHSSAAFRRVLGRAFSHSVMKQACASFCGGQLKKSVAKGLPTSFVIPPVIQQMAAMFVELQEKRHLADYDLTESFTRFGTLYLIEQAQRRATDFATLPPSDEKRFFLSCLWAWKDLAGR